MRFFRMLFFISWMLATGLSSTRLSKCVVAEAHWTKSLLKELHRRLRARAFSCRSAFCGRSKGVLAVQLCAAEPVGSGCELACQDINWTADTELLLLTLLQVICVVIFGGGLVANSWSRWKGGRWRAVILQTGSRLLRGRILTAWERWAKAQFLWLGTLTGWGTLDHQRTSAVLPICSGATVFLVPYVSLFIGATLVWPGLGYVTLALNSILCMGHRIVLLIAHLARRWHQAVDWFCLVPDLLS